MRTVFLKAAASLLAVVMLVGCSAEKFVPDNSYLLDKVELRSDAKDFRAADLMPYIRQQGNSKWFSLFKIPLSTYSLSGRDTTKWINRTLQKIGEEPVLFDTLQARLSCEDLRNAMYNLGYMNAQVELHQKIRGKRLQAVYMLHPGEPYYINSVAYDIQDTAIANVLRLDLPQNQVLQSGSMFTVNSLNAERKRITSLLNDAGYYRFHKDFITYTADSTLHNKRVDVTMHIAKYRINNDDEPKPHPRYTIRKISYRSNDSLPLRIRTKVLDNTMLLDEGGYFSAADLQKTYNNFGRLGAVRYTNIRFDEIADSNQLDCNVLVSMNKTHSISFRPEGTNTAGDLGAAASLTYTNRNLFRGSEQLTVDLRAAVEAITRLEGYDKHDYREFGIEAKLLFPRFLAPLLSSNFRRRSTASSELSIAWNWQNRPEFHRRVLSSTWRYKWNNPGEKIAYTLDLLDLNFIKMPWISDTFKHDYLDNATSRNAILRYNYEDLLIMKTGFGLRYNDRYQSLRANIETSGNLLRLLSPMLRFGKNDQGQYTVLRTAFAQYAKFDVDYVRRVYFDEHNHLAFHAGLGISYPYGNSQVLPFEKRYFSGGANSVRGWSVRELGPGSFKGKDGRIDFINQTGDLKLDLNIEYRTHLFWKFDGAVFIDAGNIWTLRSYEDQPGGKFRFSDFYKQIAVAYGVGLRMNFGYFIIRADMGMKAINPAYETTAEHYALWHPDFSRDFKFHFAVGMPF